VFIDAHSVPQGAIVEADVCVIGAGAAGITLAHEFIGQPFRVCVLESGGFEVDGETQSLYRGENIGIPYFRGTTAGATAKLRLYAVADKCRELGE